MAAFDPLLWDNSLLVLATVLLVATALAVIAKVRRAARERVEARPEDLLTDLQRAYINGQLNDAEFQRIQQSLRKRHHTADTSDGPAFEKTPQRCTADEPMQKPPAAT